jgi:Arc/MetJ-type ribon-helix-helix transcriptional regulator
MYTYIVMERTQIYLTSAQTTELDKRAHQRGTTRSHLIREAVQTYLGSTWDAEAFVAALDQFAGVWADRDDIDEIHERMREAGRRKLKQLHPDYGSEADDADDRR